LPEKLLCDKLSPYKFFVAVGIYFPLPSCHKFENRQFDILNLLLNNQTEKRTRETDYLAPTIWRRVVVALGCFVASAFLIDYYHAQVVASRTRVPKVFRAWAAFRYSLSLGEPQCSL